MYWTIVHFHCDKVRASEKEHISNFTIMVLMLMMCLKERCNYLTGTLGSARHFLELELCTHIFAAYSQQRT